MTWVLVTLSVLAAVLPAAGIVRLLARSRAALGEVERRVAERGHSTPVLADLSARIGDDITAPARTEVRELWIDVALVGGGLALGAVANVWALFL